MAEISLASKIYSISPPLQIPIRVPIRSSSQMNLAFNIPSLKSSTFSCLRPKSVRTTAASRISQIPARDRVIDLGKYKGRMLGSLPSSYLKWISKNLRAGDTVEWANLADEVLTDPVYRDRIEWETAERILSGNAAAAAARPSSDGSGAVAELLEISQRFGWDNEDKSGWSKVDFGFLGTSKGGRIPRVASAVAAAAESNDEIGRMKKGKVKKVEGILGEDGGRRRERREKMRRRTGKVIDYGNGEEVNGEEGGGDAVVVSPATARSPFPGREALLKKVLNRQKIV